MKDQKLAEITDELVQAGRFLGGFTGEMLECIQSFCACQNIVKWIRKTTKGKLCGSRTGQGLACVHN